MPLLFCLLFYFFLFSTTPCTGPRQDSATTPHDSLRTSLSGSPAVVTRACPRPHPQLRRGRSTGVKVADLHDGSSIAIGARDKNRPQKRKGQSYQDTDKHPSSQQRSLSLPDARPVPAAKPGPPLPGSRGQLPSLPQSFPISITSTCIVRASSNRAYHPSNEFGPPANGPNFNLTRPGYYSVPNTLEQAAGFWTR